LNCYARRTLPLTRDIDAALATMTPDVAWPKAFEGGSAHGHQEVAYWTKQWSEIRTWSRFLFTWRMLDVLIGVHQVVRDPAGTVLADEHVGHRYTLSMHGSQICLPPASGHGT